MRKAFVVTALAGMLAAPLAWADRGGHGNGHGNGHAYGWDRPQVVVVPAPAPAVLVYPPWIVQRQGQYTYHPEYRPVRAPSTTTRCGSDTVGRVLGGIVGGALGSQIGGGNGRTLAIIGGAVAGVLVGGEVGRRMDARDQACVGEVLEVAPVGRRVQWVDSRITYVVIPGRVVMRQGAHCRPYTLDMQRGRGWQRTEGWACRRPGGIWVAA
jgi:surface antigen